MRDAPVLMSSLFLNLMMRTKIAVNIAAIASKKHKPMTAAAAPMDVA
jgi:hypothetical protein